MQDSVNYSIGNGAPVSASIDIADVLRGVGRRKLLVGGLTLAAFLGGLAIVNVVKPIYSSEAQVLIENLETPFDRVQALDGGRIEAVDDRIVASQMSVLKSRDLGSRVIAALKLVEQPEFNAMLKGVGPVGKFKLALGFGEDPREKTPEQRAMGRYLDELTVYDQPLSNVIVIKYSAGNPNIAAGVANTLAEIYVKSTRESQSQPTGRARDWLAQQIAGLRLKVAESEAAAERFRSEAGLLQGATGTLGTQEISELNTQITLAEAARSETQARANAIRQLLASKGSVDASSDVLASPLIQRLKEQQVTAARRVAELSAVYLSSHPKMMAARNELDDANRQIRGEALKVVQGLEEQAQIAAARQKSLRAGLEALKSEESGANLEEVKLKALERDAATDRVLLETMLARFADASARQNLDSQPGMARIIQSATVPSHPSFPKRGPMVLLTTLAGLSLGLGLAFLLELMAAASRLNQRLQAAGNGPARNPVPQRVAAFSVESKSSPRLAMPVNQQAEINAAAAKMAGWALDLRQRVSTSRFAVTSIGGGEGDTSVAALGLARGLAARGKRVILADLASGGSWLERLCAVIPGPGITEIVSGHADFAKIAGRDSESPVHLLRYGLDRSPGSMAAVDQKIEAVLTALDGSYDMVIVHAGEAVSAAAGLMQKCEAALILAGPTRTGDAKAAARSLEAMGLRSVQVIALGQRTAAAA